MQALANGLVLVGEYGRQHKFVSTLLLVAILLTITSLIVRIMRNRSQLKGEDKRHAINTFKQLSYAVTLVAVVAVWSAEVQRFAISIAAFTVAIVLATKEFIQCFLGFVYYLGARPFRVGDWIQLSSKGLGEVVEIDWAKVALLEVDTESFEYTGKHVYVPNSQLVTHTVKNLNFLRRYTIHTFKLTFEPHMAVHQYRNDMQAFAAHHCNHFSEVAERYKGLIERHLDTEFIETEPQVMIDTNEFAKSVVTVALFCPTNEASLIQQHITNDIMAHLYNAQASVTRPHIPGTTQLLSLRQS